MTWRLARTLEVPDEQGDHVLFTHPKTWLRDLDPFARSRYPMTTAEKARDQSLWPGLELSYCLPARHIPVVVELHAMQRTLLVPRRHGKMAAIEQLNADLRHGIIRYRLPVWSLDGV